MVRAQLSMRIRITVFQIDSRQPDFRAWAGSLREDSWGAYHQGRGPETRSTWNPWKRPWRVLPQNGALYPTAPGSSGFGVSGHLSLTFNS